MAGPVVPAGAVLPVPEFGAIILAGGRATRLGQADKPALVVGAAPMAATVTAAVVEAGARQVVLVGPERPELAAALAGRLPGGLAVTREDPPGSGPVPALRAGLALIATPWVAVLAADLPFLNGEAVADLVRAAVAARPAGLSGKAAPVAYREAGPAAGGAEGRVAGTAPAGLAVAGEAVEGAAVEGVAVAGEAVAGVANEGAAVAGAAIVGAAAVGAVVADADGAVQWLAGCWRTEQLRAALDGYTGASLRGLLRPLRPVVVSSAGPPGDPSPWLDCDTPADLAAARAWQAAGAGARPNGASRAPDDDAGESEAER